VRPRDAWNPPPGISSGFIAGVDVSGGESLARQPLMTVKYYGRGMPPDENFAGRARSWQRTKMWREPGSCGSWQVLHDARTTVLLWLLL